MKLLENIQSEEIACCMWLYLTKSKGKAPDFFNLGSARSVFQVSFWALATAVFFGL